MTRDHRIWAAFAAVLIALGCGSKPQNATAEQAAQAPASSGGAAATGSASITGTVKFSGAAPAAAPVSMAADPACQEKHATPVASDEVVVGANGGLKNVFVYVKEGVSGSFPTPAAPVQLTQTGCWYVPHVFGLQVDQPLEIVNDDATLHNVNAKPTANQAFNIAQPVQGMKSTKKFAKPELGVKFKCNVHPWMHAYGHVVAHPFFAVSGADGSFSITGLPAGTYTLEAWHEKYGTQTQQVTVGSGQAQSASFSFSGS